GEETASAEELGAWPRALPGGRESAGIPVTTTEGQATLSEGGSSCRASGLLERRLCDGPASVASSRLRPTIPPFLDRERHITLSLPPRNAPVSPGHGSLMTATGTRNPREIAGRMDSLRVLRSGSLCGVCPVSSSMEQAVAQGDVT